jgi:5-methylcytosine-specific restriction endonuclease McrBC GTP-binding regulatory subunit McrB
MSHHVSYREGKRRRGVIPIDSRRFLNGKHRKNKMDMDK